MLPKVLWVKEHQPEIYEQVRRRQFCVLLLLDLSHRKSQSECFVAAQCTTWLEYGEWLLCQMTGTVALSANTATQVRTHPDPVRTAVETNKSCRSSMEVDLTVAISCP